MQNLDGLRAELRKSFMHRMAADCACAICGNKTSPLAFHILEISFTENAALPAGFVPMSKSMGRVRGFFPSMHCVRPSLCKMQPPHPDREGA